MALQKHRFGEQVSAFGLTTNVSILTMISEVHCKILDVTDE